MKLQQAGSPRSPLRGVPQAYRYALDPTPAQERRLRSHAGAARFAWNWALTRVTARYEAEKKWYSAEELHRLWNAEKKTNPELAWWSENSKCVYQEAFRNLDRALEDFSKSKKGLRKGAPAGLPSVQEEGPVPGFLSLQHRGDALLGLDGHAAPAGDHSHPRVHPGIGGQDRGRKGQDPLCHRVADRPAVVRVLHRGGGA